MYNSARKKSDSAIQQPNFIIKEKPKFARLVSIARLFGNAYSTHQHMSQRNLESATPNKSRNALSKFKLERFKHRSENQIDHVTSDDIDVGRSTKLPIEDFCDEKDLGHRAFRTLSRGLGMIWRRSYSIEISSPDPEYKVFYLGNVLTGWAKGDNCIEKPLATLWRNYTQINKPDVTMRVLVCPSGLKATTRQHGLTEYWSNRITYCCSPKNYPRVFCWIYRHEGRKLKHELRCHAVLCPKESISEEICKTLKENLSQAKEFKRDKISRQNARLSLVNSLYENPSMPRRKILLSVGANNYRPPMERSKSAPKLMAIEEAIGEEEDINLCATSKRNRDILFPSATYTRQRSKSIQMIKENSKSRRLSLNTRHLGDHPSEHKLLARSTSNILSDDDDDFNNLLLTNDYDIKSSLSGEFLSYFDSKLNGDSSINASEFRTNPNGIDGPTDATDAPYNFDSTFNHPSSIYCDSVHDNDQNSEPFSQNDMKDMKAAESSTANNKVFNYSVNGNAIGTIVFDSDEGSITSGCETSSIITNAQFEDLMKPEREIEAISLRSSNKLPSPSNLEKVKEVEIDVDSGDRVTIRNNEEDSEFSDESGFDENNIGKLNTSMQEQKSADANNNFKHALSSNIKSMGRLRINIPKNAKSIDI